MVRKATVNGYLEAQGDGHPLTWNNGSVADHRRILYDKIGPGPHPCHWCSVSVDWEGPRGNGKLYVDHLDHDRLNNTGDNLVPSCMHCNVKRHRDAEQFQPGQLSEMCKRGHPLVDENLYFTKEGRRCRRCFLDYLKAYRAKA